MKKIIKCISSIGLGSMISIGVICHGGPGDKADGNNPNNDPNNNPNNINNNLQKINTGDVNNNPDINPNNINNPGNDEPTVTKSGYTAWVSADEATDDVFRWGNGGVNGDYIKGKIKATTKEALDSRNKAKIENALCKLWESGGSIGSVSSTILGLIEYTKGATNINEKLKEVVNNNIVVGPLANSLIKNNLSPDDFMKIRNNLVRVLESKQLELASEIVGSDNKQGMTDDDFVSLA
ncbi:MAG: hypothetical protein LBI37_02245, partial [Puniceicoccales bacterium]|nr:hypothetical protein [Puniceicoccales bacterium]